MKMLLEGMREDVHLLREDFRASAQEQRQLAERTTIALLNQSQVSARLQEGLEALSKRLDGHEDGHEKEWTLMNWFTVFKRWPIKAGLAAIFLIYVVTDWRFKQWIEAEVRSRVPFIFAEIPEEGEKDAKPAHAPAER